MLLRGKILRTGALADVLCDEGRISAVGPATSARPDLEAEWIHPALFDLQINGCLGIAFGSANLTTDQVRQVTHVCHQHGVGAYLPTIVTGGFEDVSAGLRAIRKARDEDPALARAIPGIHLEGPYISAEDGPRGAHPRQHVRPADWEEFCRFQEAAGGLIHLTTLAPEVGNALSFIKNAVSAGVVVSIGHTAATRDEIRQAIDAGATLSTHLGNGSHAVLPRHENYIWEQLAADQLWASIIADGWHLPEAILRCIIRAKGAERLILTCDAGPLAGSPPGRYRLWEQDFEVVPEGKIVVPRSRFLAGSWAFTDHCVSRLLKLREVSLSQAVAMAESHPRRLLGYPERSVEPGMPAELVLFNCPAGSNFEVVATVVSASLFLPN